VLRCQCRGADEVQMRVNRRHSCRCTGVQRRCRRCRGAGADIEVQRWSRGPKEVQRCRGADMEVEV